MKYILIFLSFLWQFPQDVIGYILFTIYTLTSYEWESEWNEHGCILYADSFKGGGISLGHFVIMPFRYKAKVGKVKYVTDTFMHETVGHRIQSLYLGWLYLIVIGIPSIVWAGLHRLKKFSSINYYSFYTEKWADRIAGIDR